VKTYYCPTCRATQSRPRKCDPCKAAGAQARKAKAKQVYHRGGDLGPLQPVPGLAERIDLYSERAQRGEDLFGGEG